MTKNRGTKKKREQPDAPPAGLGAETILAMPRYCRDDGVWFTRGETVKVTNAEGVTDASGSYISPRAVFRFMGIIRHRDGDQWAALYGGSLDPNGNQGFRYVDPDRVEKVKR